MTQALTRPHAPPNAPTILNYARVAGATYLLLIVVYMGGQWLVSSALDTATLATAARSVAHAETLIRLGLCLQMLAPLGTVVLAYALFVITDAVDPHRARMALLFRLGESIIGAVAVFASFNQLEMYKRVDAAVLAQPGQWEALLSLSRSSHFVGFNTSTLFFSVGSILFFSLLLQGRRIPKVQAVFGLFASVAVTFVSLANMIVPQYGSVLQLGWAPIFISEIVTGLWLLTRGVRLTGAR